MDVNNFFSAGDENDLKCCDELKCQEQYIYMQISEQTEMAGD